MAPKKKQHYVDNKKFLAELVKYRDRIQIAEKKGLKKPRITEYIGECFLKIATHLSYRPNFINYMYKEDMIGDAIELYPNSYNPVTGAVNLPFDVL